MKTLETPKNIKAKGSSSDYNVPTREISAVETNLSFVFNLNNSQSVYIEDITRWREDMNFIFEWQNNILRTSAASE